MRSEATAVGTRPLPGGPKAALSYQVVPMLGELLLLTDPLCVFAAAWISTRLYDAISGATGQGGALHDWASPAVWVLAVLALFILRDGRLGAWASRGQLRPMLKAHAWRLLVLAVIAAALAMASGTLEASPLAWIALWAATSASATTLARLVFVLFVRRLQSLGRLTEVVAVVGAGPAAQRLVDELRLARPYAVDVIGMFEDTSAHDRTGASATAGTIDDLLRIGAARRIDWILLAPAPGAQARVPALVQRLKALSVPIGLCSQPPGMPARRIGYLGDTMAVTMLGDDRDPARGEGVQSDPAARWIRTLTSLLHGAVTAGTRGAVAMAGGTTRPPPRRYCFDDFDLSAFSERAAHFGQQRFGFVVTPNADHLIRLHEDETFRVHYAQADYILLDSRFLAHLLRWTRGLRLPVCTGSDLTARLFASVIQPDDPILLIGGSARQADTLRSRHGLRQLHHHNPPMGFIQDPEAVEDCLRFIEARSPFRFCLLAVGSPQQEALAALLKSRGRARGLTLCIGAAINFLTGDERRAPTWMQQGGLEWLYRLVRAPKRMARRYLVRGPRVFGLLHGAEVILRPRTTEALPKPPPWRVRARPQAIAQPH